MDKDCCFLLESNVLFSTDMDDQSAILEGDSQALQDIVAEQGTSLNVLKQLTDSLKRDAVTLEQQGNINQLQQQVCLHAILVMQSANQTVAI